MSISIFGWRRVRTVAREKTCTVEWCDRSARARGLCGTHYNNYRRGEAFSRPQVRVVMGTVADTLDAWGRYVPATGCLEWTRAKSSGYGTITWGGATRYVHRLAYVEAYGGIPDGLSVDHMCGNRACFNPDHLNAVTHQQNLQHRKRSYPLSGTGMRGAWVRGERYLAAASVGGVRHFAGLHDTPEAAAKAAAKLRERLGFYAP